MPPSTVEIKVMDGMIKTIQRKSGADPAFKKAMNYFFTQTTIDHPEIFFSTKSQFKQFFASFEEIVAIRNFYIILTPFKGWEIRNNQYWSSAVSNRLNVSQKRVKNRNLYPNGQLSIQYLHPDTERKVIECKTKRLPKKFGSNAFKCLLHLYAIFFGAQKRQLE